MHEHDEVVLELDSAFGQVPKESCYNVYMYICMYICIYVCIYIYSQIHIYTYTYRIVTDCNILHRGHSQNDATLKR